MNTHTTFATWGTEHIVILILFTLFSILSIWWTKRYCSYNQQRLILNAVAVGVCLLTLLGIGIKVYTGVFEISKDLPLYLCNLMTLLLPVFTFSLNYKIYEVFYFWIIGGTLHAIITPDLQSVFPDFFCLKYWLTHLGLIYAIVFATVIFRLRPQMKSIWKSIAWLEVYFVLMIIVNFLVGANYCYLNRKPESATLLDHFGPWPLYIIVVQLIIIPYFFLLYVPFWRASKNTQKR